MPALRVWIVAAQYLGVPVWDLVARDDGRWWRDEALRLRNIEVEVENRRAQTGK
jgi:hypothetical protein